jgi:sugar lactone lactonase YvrE
LHGRFGRIERVEHVHCVWAAGASLGEGPLWVPDEAALYWLDIGRSQVHRFVPQTDERRSWSFPETVSCIARRRSGAFVAATRAGFAFLDLALVRSRPLLAARAEDVSPYPSSRQYALDLPPTARPLATPWRFRRRAAH